MSNHDSTCPKCGGTSGRYLVETLKRKRFETWDREHIDIGDETLITQTWWRCTDCNAYKVPQGIVGDQS